VSTVANGHKARPAIVDQAADPFMTAQEAAAIVGVAVCTIQEWARTGRVPSFKPAGCRRLLFRRSELDAWAAGGELETRILAAGGRKVSVRKPRKA
jgi:excisionase family DNA binding protein